MYKAIRQVEITFPLEVSGPGAVVVEPGETFEIESHGRNTCEWDVLIHQGEEYPYPRWNDIRLALETGDLVEV